MDALILAAGDGTRLQPLTKDTAKVMIKIQGVPILERSLHVLKNVGVKRIVIVIGHKGEIIKKYFGSEWGGMKIFYKKTDWYGDGISKSAIKGKDDIKNRFIFLCGDTIPEEKSLKLALEKEGDMVISIRNSKDDSVVAEVLKNGSVKNIGMRKEIKKFNKTVAGISVNEPVFFDAIGDCVKNNKFDRPDAIKWMIKKGYKVNSFDISKDTLLEIDTHEDLKKAKKTILEDAVSKKIKKENLTFVIKYLNLPITKRLAGLFARTKLTPNQLTMLGLLVFLLAGVSFFYQNFLVGGILAMSARLFDSIDGKIARLKFLESQLGDFLEKITDIFGDVFVLIGLSFGLYFFHNSSFILMAGLLTTIMRLTPALISLNIEYYYRKYYQLFSKIYFIKVVGDRHLIYLFLMIVCIIGLPLLGLFYFSFIFGFLTLLRAVYVFKLVIENK